MIVWYNPSEGVRTYGKARSHLMNILMHLDTILGSLITVEEKIDVTKYEDMNVYVFMNDKFRGNDFNPNLQILTELIESGIFEKISATMYMKTLVVKGHQSEGINLCDEKLPIHPVIAEKSQEEYKLLEDPPGYKKEMGNPIKKVQSHKPVVPHGQMYQTAISGIKGNDRVNNLVPQTEHPADPINTLVSQNKSRTQSYAIDSEFEEEALIYGIEFVFGKGIKHFENEVMRLKKLTIQQFLMVSSITRVNETAKRCIKASVAEFLENDKDNYNHAKLHKRLKKNINSLVAVYCLSLKFMKKQSEPNLDHQNVNYQA